MKQIFDPGEVIQIAVRIEENGEKFYRKMADQFREPEIHELFEFLAEEEVSHKDFYDNLYAEFKTYDPPAEHQLEYFEYIKSFANDVMFSQKEFEKNLNSITEVKDALEIAINTELNAILYFHEMKGMVKKEKRDILDKIISEERLHFIKLSNMKRKLEGKK